MSIASAITTLHPPSPLQYRAPLVDLHLDQSDAPALRIAAAVTTLTRLELLSHPTAGLMCALLSSTPRGQHAPFKLEWLAHNTALQHLAAPLAPTGEVGAQGIGVHSSFEIFVSTSSWLCLWQNCTLLSCQHLSLLVCCCRCPGALQDLAGLDGQLRSLTGYCMPSEELLRQVLRVGSELTSLTLYQTGGRACTGPHLLAPLCYRMCQHWRDMCVTQRTHGFILTCLSQLRPPMPQHVCQNTRLQSRTPLPPCAHRLQNHTSRRGPHSRGASAATSPSLPGPQRPCCTCTRCA